MKQFPILQFFAYEHLPPALQAVSKPFGDAARQLAADATEFSAGAEPDVAQVVGQETAAGLRKLLEAKDCFVRAAIAGAKK